MTLTIEAGAKVQLIAQTETRTRLERFEDYTQVYLNRYLSQDEVQTIFSNAAKIANTTERAHFLTSVVREVDRHMGGVEIVAQLPADIPLVDDGAGLKDYSMYKWRPVGVREFVSSSYYLDKEREVYPAVLADLEEINSGRYVEALLTGGIGSAKTTTALYTQAYQLYLLSCMRNPHHIYKLDPASEIIFIFQSITATLAKSVDYARFKAMIETCTYFREKFPFDKNIDSLLIFPNRIQVKPISGKETAAIGQNVIGGLIDELNYMSVVEKSKQSVDKGTFDQAIALYNSIARRRKTRFMEQGEMPGILCLVSSKKYPGQFTDQKEEEARTDPTIYVSDKCVWDIKPEGTFRKGWFHVFVGDLSRKPRILDVDEVVPDEDRLMVRSIPIDFRNDFEKDIINALREIAGVSTLARHPYFVEVEKVNTSLGRHRSIFAQTTVDFVATRLTILKDNFHKPNLPRFVHIDLAKTGDSAGVGIGCVDDFVALREMGQGNEAGMMPKFHIDGVLEVTPPRNSEILFWKIREVLITLRKMGLNIRWVTYDSFESTDSQQILRQQGFVTGYQSVDLVPCRPYDFCKSAIYDGRVEQPEHPHLQRELLMLERDVKTGKVDHPPGGSKDCADALAGVVYGLTMRREIWGMFGVAVASIPSSVLAAVDKDKLEAKNQKLAQDLQIASMSDTDRIRMRLS